MGRGEDMAETLDKLVPKGKKTNTSRNKGKRGERAFAEMLSEVSGLHFERIYASGAAVGQSNSRRLEVMTEGQALAQLGDIMPPETLEWRLIFESKNYKSLDLHNLLRAHGSKTVTGWLGELMWDVESALTNAKEREPLGFLMVKLTNMGEFVVVNEGMMLRAFGHDGLKVPTPFMSFLITPRPALQDAGWNLMFYMCEARPFFEAHKESLFKESAELLALLEKLRARR